MPGWSARNLIMSAFRRAAVCGARGSASISGTENGSTISAPAALSSERVFSKLARMRGRHPHGSTGVGADANQRETRRDARTRAARGTAGRVGGVVGIPGEAGEDGVDVVAAAGGELRERCLAENDAAGSLDFGDQGSVGRRKIVLPTLKARGHRHARGVDAILHEDRNAMQRADELTRGSETCVERIRFGQRLRIEVDDRVKVRALLVVGSDAREMRGDDVVDRDLAAEIGSLDAGNG